MLSLWLISAYIIPGYAYKKSTVDNLDKNFEIENIEMNILQNFITHITLV